MPKIKKIYMTEYHFFTISGKLYLLNLIFLKISRGEGGINFFFLPNTFFTTLEFFIFYEHFIQEGRRGRSGPSGGSIKLPGKISRWGPTLKILFFPPRHIL